MSQLVAHRSLIFRLFMKKNFNADLLSPLDKLVQNWILDQLHSFGHFTEKNQIYHNSFAHCEVSLHAWSDDHFNWNSLASIMIQEVCSSRLESFSSNNKQRIFLAPSWVFSAWHPQFLALLRNTWLLCSIFACNAARTTDAQWGLFFIKIPNF